MFAMRVLLVLGLLVGCHQPPEEKAEDVCDAYCDCVHPGALPAQFDECVQQQCLPQLPPVSDACLDCVFEHDQVCTDLLSQCTNSCFPNDAAHLGGMQ
jgi:hypothetical protein